MDIPTLHRTLIAVECRVRSCHTHSPARTEEQLAHVIRHRPRTPQATSWRALHTHVGLDMASPGTVEGAHSRVGVCYAATLLPCGLSHPKPTTPRTPAPTHSSWRAAVKDRDISDSARVAPTTFANCLTPSPTSLTAASLMSGSSQ